MKLKQKFNLDNTVLVEMSEDEWSVLCLLADFDKRFNCKDVFFGRKSADLHPALTAVSAFVDTTKTLSSAISILTDYRNTMQAPITQPETGESEGENGCRCSCHEDGDGMWK